MKDARISGGDIVYGEDGSPELVEGIDLLSQQAEFAARIPKGSFIYDRELGAFGDLPNDSDPDRDRKYEAMMREAMIKTEGKLEVDSTARVSGVMTMTLTLSDMTDSIQREVSLIG